MNAFVATLVQILAFFGIGLLGAFALQQRKFIGKHYIVIGAYAVSCLLYYVLFFTYALSPALGACFTGLIYFSGTASAMYLAYMIGRRANLRRIFAQAVLPVLVIIFSLASVYSVTTFSCHYRKSTPNTHWVFYQACVLYDATGDNVLPYLFAQQLVSNKEYDRLGDWYLADRPPLEIGGVVSLLDALPNDEAQASAYEFFSIILQLAWVPALWALLNSMRVSRKRQYYVLFVCSMTGFFYYNTIYPWPKFLAASFGIATIGMLLYSTQATKKLSPRVWLVASVLISLSMLAHGSAVYLVIPLLIYLTISRKLPTLKTLSLCFLAALVIYGPWAIYQNIAAPNPRLAKWQLAGVISSADKRSASEAIFDSYSNLSLHQWASDRVSNVKFLFVADYNAYWGNVEDTPTKEPFLVHVAKDPGENTLLDKARKQDFFSLFPALGILSLGWLILIYNKFKRRDTGYNLTPLLLVVAIGLTAWIVLSFIPGSTLNFTNSYAVMMLIFTILLTTIASSRAFIRYGIFTLQFALFYAIWVYGLYKINHKLHLLVPVTLFMLIFYCAALFYYLRHADTDG